MSQQIDYILRNLKKTFFDKFIENTPMVVDNHPKFSLPISINNFRI